MFTQTFYSILIYMSIKFSLVAVKKEAAYIHDDINAEYATPLSLFSFKLIAPFPIP